MHGLAKDMYLMLCNLNSYVVDKFAGIFKFDDKNFFRIFNPAVMSLKR